MIGKAFHLQSSGVGRALAVALALTAGGALAAAEPAADVAWVRAPSIATMSKAYPVRAAERNLGGKVTLNCGVTIRLTLANCRSVSEAPKELGFLAAAQALSYDFLAPPEVAPGSRVLVSFAFTPGMIRGAAPVTGAPAFARLPTALEMAAAYPKPALAAGVTAGRGDIRCEVVDGGWLSGCVLVAEAPAGRGFGQAALQLSPHFKMTPWTKDGLPTIGGEVDIPVSFVARTSAR